MSKLRVETFAALLALSVSLLAGCATREAPVESRLENMLSTPTASSGL